MYIYIAWYRRRFHRRWMLLFQMEKWVRRRCRRHIRSSSVLSQVVYNLYQTSNIPMIETMVHL